MGFRRKGWKKAVRETPLLPVNEGEFNAYKANFPEIFNNPDGTKTYIKEGDYVILGNKRRTAISAEIFVDQYEKLEGYLPPVCQKYRKKNRLKRKIG